MLYGTGTLGEIDGLEAVGEKHETDLQPRTKSQQVCPSKSEEGATTLSIYSHSIRGPAEGKDHRRHGQSPA